MKHVLLKPIKKLQVRILTLVFLSMLVFHTGYAFDSVKSIEDVIIRLDIRQGNLQDILRHIESKTDFRFFYSDKGLEDPEILQLNQIKGSVADILTELARERRLHFKQVNNTISVRFLDKKVGSDALEIIVDVADIEVSGKVVSADGEPLPGVAVAVAGTTIGTITNIDGEFSLIAPEDGELLFSYIGFATQRMEINSRSIINVTLQEDIAGLEEVVVTALGIKREAKSLGYATSTVESEEMTINRTPNFINSLQGKVAGVNISSMGSGPQGSSKIRIRGYRLLGVTIRH